MHDKIIEIQTDYTEKSTTSSIEQTRPIPYDAHIEVDKYGTGKPTRIRIHARIAHDDND